MKKTMLLLLVACLVAMVGCGRGSARTETAPGSSEVATAAESGQPEPGAVEKPIPNEGNRAAKYGRLAIVCAPVKRADPEYAFMVLNEIEAKVPKYLSYLQKVNIVPDASIDTSTATLTVRFKNINDYDAVAVITYSYSTRLVIMGIYLIDAKTGQQVWFQQLQNVWKFYKGKGIELRLAKLALQVPSRINKYFYRKG